MEPLNPHLFNQLRRAFGHVGITNDGQEMHGTYFPDWRLGVPRMRLSILDWGESYRVSCPFCSDTRQRLYISHRWSVRDPLNWDDNLHLCKCFNEECLGCRNIQKQLHAMVFPDGVWADRVEVPPKPIKTDVQTAGPSIAPPGTPLYDLHRSHPLRTYLSCRGFDADQLGREYHVEYSLPCTTCQPALKEPRIIIPLYEYRPSLGPEGEMRRIMAFRVGWQARAITTELPEGCPKYLTSSGTKKNRLLYGLGLAVKSTGPVVVVEGVTDAWKVGRSAVALLGKTISIQQRELLRKYVHGRPLVVWLDRDAEIEAQKVLDAIRQDRITGEDSAPTLIAHTPTGRKDPGDCRHEEIANVLAALSFAD